MDKIKLSPAQKRERKRKMYNDWKEGIKNPEVIRYELRTKLATKYKYKNEKVVEQTILRIENKIVQG